MCVCLYKRFPFLNFYAILPIVLEFSQKQTSCFCFGVFVCVLFFISLGFFFETALLFYCGLPEMNLIIKNAYLLFIILSTRKKEAK